MFILIKLAYRNVFRNLRRSVLSFIAISLGLCFSIFSMGLTRGFEDRAFKLTINTRTAHLKIYGKGYINEKDMLPLDYPIEDYNNLLNKLKNINEIKNVAPRIIFSGNLNDGIDELTCIGAGIDLESEDEVFNRKESVKRGEYLISGEEKMLIGRVLAELFKVDVGDFLTVVTRTKYNTITALDLQIKGIVNSGNPEIDNQYFFIPIDLAQNFLEMENEINEISIKLHNSENIVKVKNTILSLEEYKNKLDVETYKEIVKDLIQFFSLRKNARILITFVILLMAAAGIANTILMSVFERIREIGTMMAFGMKSKNIVYLFCLESTFIGLFGSIIGCSLGSALTYYFEVHGINLEEIGFGNIKDSAFTGTIYLDLTFGMVVLAFLIGIGVSVLSALYPSFKASKIVPSEALKKV